MEISKSVCCQRWKYEQHNEGSEFAGCTVWKRGVGTVCAHGKARLPRVFLQGGVWVTQITEGPVKPSALLACLFLVVFYKIPHKQVDMAATTQVVSEGFKNKNIKVQVPEIGM